MKALTTRRFPLGSTALIVFLIGFFVRVQSEIHMQTRLRQFKVEDPGDVDGSLAAMEETAALLERDAWWANAGFVLMGIGVVLMLVRYAERSRLRRERAAIQASQEAMQRGSRKQGRRFRG